MNRPLRARRIARLGLLAAFIVVVFGSADVATPDPQAPPGNVRGLEFEQSEPAIGLELEPPPPGFIPAVTGNEALAIAWREEGRREATSATAKLGLLSSSQFKGLTDRPVWQIVYEGVCVRAHGVVPGPRECFASEYYVIVDAATGSFLMAYANEYPGKAKADDTPASIDSPGASGSTGTLTG